MKRLLSALIAVLLLICVAGCDKGYEPAPEITYGEFPFVLEYEMNGERYIIEDTVVCSFDGYDLSDPFPLIDYSRTWYASLKNKSQTVIIEFEENTESLLVKDRINTESKVVLYYGSGGYYLGDPDEKDKAPCINYVEEYQTSEKVSHNEVTPLDNKQLEEIFGIEIIRFEFSEPIENEFN